MFAFLKALVRLLPAVYESKRDRSRMLREMSRATQKYEPFHFTLDEMFCPICKRQPHKGLTKQLSARARAEGYVSCEMHGPVKADIVPISANSKELPEVA